MPPDPTVGIESKLESNEGMVLAIVLSQVSIFGMTCFAISFSFSRCSLCLAKRGGSLLPLRDPLPVLGANPLGRATT